MTGASSGIGLALSKRLLNDGWKVAMIARSKDKMDTEIKQNDAFAKNAFIIPADLSDATQCQYAYNMASEWSVLFNIFPTSFIFVLIILATHILHTNAQQL